MLDADLRTAAANLADVDHLLVALDFDGTLAPFAPTPDEARALPGSAAALARLASGPDGPRRTTTALLSGRHLESLRIVAAPPETTLLVGSHGAERFSAATGELPLTLTPEQESLLERTTASLREIADSHPNAALEHKPSGVVLHVRQCPTAEGARLLEQAKAALHAEAGLTVTEGKAVLEAAVVRVDKGVGLAWLREQTKADVVVFVGDDVTDEHAFATLNAADVGVKVGEGPTAARFRVGSLEDVTEFLTLITSVRDL
ncbi:trehalose-phosphatase [Zhihengliuella flava]|uniref:Trehalose 6-phosphate phosphatase n=1 Tax=Zhihengliuella flava TaxID=1285193 RepID=A0A931GJD6_9MICC|nr:trehalose-phosphatase [Zhihengliuella flava]MBG6085221.1 trehalose 6-phosphate phosphatase [Zhihengliuella flava]